MSDREGPQRPSLFRRIRTIISAVALTTLPALAVVPLAGCVVSGSRTITVEGRRVGVFSLEQIEIGETNVEWVQAAFGDPTSRESWTSEDSSIVEVWRYDWRRTEKSNGAILLLFAASERSVESESTYVEFTDGVVTRFWTESQS